YKPIETVAPPDANNDGQPDSPHYPGSFVSTIVDGILNIEATDTGFTTIKITAVDGSGDEEKNISFEVFLYSADLDIISKMGTSTTVRNNREYVSSWFGTFRDTDVFPTFE